ncbi:MAG: arsenate reductase family protein [Eggerthellaceae bacterium]|nr:arsenate reductase family protein [Eggerthellaceae bacterium]
MADVLFLEYPKCSTCRKARAWLESKGVSFHARHIVEDNPTVEELKTWHEMSGLPVRRFFNTSGMLYRELDVKAKLDAGMTDDEAYRLLASNGMLVKRPLLIIDGKPTTPGFKEADWTRALGL